MTFYTHPPPKDIVIRHQKVGGHWLLRDPLNKELRAVQAKWGREGPWVSVKDFMFLIKDYYHGWCRPTGAWERMEWKPITFDGEEVKYE